MVKSGSNSFHEKELDKWGVAHARGEMIGSILRSSLGCVGKLNHAVS